MLSLADAQFVANITAKILGLKVRPAVFFDNVERGMAFVEAGQICLPEHLRTKHATISTYYIVHEVCHFINGGLDHGKAFRSYEDKALAFWHISVKRGRGPYPLDIRSK